MMVSTPWVCVFIKQPTASSAKGVRFNLGVTEAKKTGCQLVIQCRTLLLICAACNAPCVAFRVLLCWCQG